MGVGAKVWKTRTKVLYERFLHTFSCENFVKTRAPRLGGITCNSGPASVRCWSGRIVGNVQRYEPYTDPGTKDKRSISAGNSRKKIVGPDETSNNWTYGNSNNVENNICGHARRSNDTPVPNAVSENDPIEKGPLTALDNGKCMWKTTSN